jgi:hypothetical protein
VSTGRELLSELESLYANDLAHWQRTHEGVTEDLLFWGGQHYLDEEDLRERDRRRLKIVGQETFNVTRHKSAQVGGAPTNVDGVIKEPGVDPIMAEVGVALVNNEVSDPEKLFDDYCDILLTGAISAGYWMLGIDYEPTIDEVVFRPLDPRNYMWEPGFHNPHDLMCGRAVEDRRMPVSLIAKMGKHGWDKKLVKEVKADSDQRPSTKGGDSQHPAETADAGNATIRFWWFKHDDSVDSKEKEGTYRELDSEDWYMGCSECGWRGEAGLGQDLPEVDECPECGGTATRTEAKADMEVRERYKKGRRLVIEAPGQGFDKPLYDGPWPLWARSFTVGFLSNYLHPSKPIGPSDTSLNWTAQLGSDLLMTMAFQRVSEFRNYYLMPTVGVTDWKGDRFEFRDDQFNTMFYKDELNPAAVQVLNGSSLDPAWNIYWQATQTVLKSAQGISDLGLTPQSSKDIASSTVSQLTAQGEIPVEHLKRRWHREKARIFGIVYDLLRQVLTPEKLSALQIEGLDDLVVGLSGEDLPDMDFVLTDAGPMGAIEKTRAEGTMLLVNVAQQNPAWIDFIAQANRIPNSVLRKVKKKMAELAAEQQAAMQMGGQPGSPNNGGQPEMSGTGEPAPPPAPMNGPPPSELMAALQGVGGMTPPQ